MSLTNPTDVVTEERLSEFYQAILPYLGGMPEAIVNKFAKGDLYSADEKIVGCWTDGRPLYQITFNVGTVNKGDTNIGTISNLGVLVRFSGSFSLSNGNKFTLPYGFAGEEDISVYATTASTGNIFISSNLNSSLLNTKVVIQYTKTSDAANSFNFSSETDYSTTEKIIGTWIDGKPLYQKTVSCGTLANKTAKQVATGVSNIQHVISCKGYGVVSGSNNHLNLPYNGTGDNIDIYWNGTSNTIDLVPNFNATVITGCYVTLQYTKTTD